MAIGPVRVEMEGQELRVAVQAGSDLLSGERRLFLSNVLGLRYDSEIGGYVTSGPSILRVMTEVLDYLRSLDAPIELNKTASDFVARLEAQRQELERTRTEGLRLKNEPSDKIEVPGLVRPLKEYQVPAVGHMATVGNAANFSVPGSGKTTITLSAFKILKSTGRVEKVVIVGPRASFMPWEDEYTACFGSRPKSVRIVGTPGERRQLYRLADDCEMILLTYQLASNDSSELVSLLLRHPCMLVIDESHNIKRITGGKRADALLEIAPYAVNRVILSGTPVPNSVRDIWSQITFLWPQELVLGNREAFKRMVERSGPDSTSALREAIFPLYWRIRKNDLQLPNPQYHRIRIPMSKYQQAIYDAIATKTIADLALAPEDLLKLKQWRRAKMIRLLEAASNPALLTRYSTEFEIPPFDASNLSVDTIIERYPEFEKPRRIEYVVDLTREIVSKKEKVIIWTSFVHNIETLAGLLQDYSPALIYGDVPKDEEEDQSHNREQIIRDFKQTSRYKILIANPSAAAESVSLQKVCHHAIYFDRTFNAAHYMQSQDRIHRIGLDPGEVVHYYIIQSAGSIDEVIDQRLEQKINVMNEILAEDFRVVNLDSPEGVFSEDSENERDFTAVLDNLRSKYGGVVA